MIAHIFIWLVKNNYKYIKVTHISYTSYNFTYVNIISYTWYKCKYVRIIYLVLI